jgi:hypothetical protein
LVPSAASPTSQQDAGCAERHACDSDDPEQGDGAAPAANAITSTICNRCWLASTDAVNRAVSPGSRTPLDSAMINSTSAG